MIRCNLAILLAEMGLKITKLSKDTGISRTTLTSLANNYSQGIQLETLNTLCCYLKITPNDLLSFVPIDVTVSYTSLSGNQLDIELTITEKSKSKDCKLSAIVTTEICSDRLDSVDIYAFLNDNDSPEKIAENELIKKTITSLPRPFLNDLENKIIDRVVDEFEYVSDNLFVSFEWQNW